VEAEPDQVERGGRGHSDAGAIVGIVGSLEQGIGIDRKADAAIDGAAVGAAQLGTGAP
jgi:hypothetical protein